MPDTDLKDQDRPKTGLCVGGPENGKIQTILGGSVFYAADPVPAFFAMLPKSEQPRWRAAHYKYRWLFKPISPEVQGLWVFDGISDQEALQSHQLASTTSDIVSRSGQKPTRNETKNHIQINIGWPICERCNVPVDQFTATLAGQDIKFEALCHGGYEMWRVRLSDANGKIIEARAFRK